MKDKLVRNHHKGLYYRLRRFFFGAVICSSIAALIAIPTYITIKNYAAKTSLATSENDDDGGDNNGDEVSNLIYQEY